MKKSVRNVSFTLCPGEFKNQDAWFYYLKRLGVGPKNLGQVEMVKFDVWLSVSQKASTLYAGHVGDV